MGSTYLEDVKDAVTTSCNNAYSSRFSIAHFDRLFVALALAVGRGRFSIGRAPSFNDLQLE